MLGNLSNRCRMSLAIKMLKPDILHVEYFGCAIQTQLCGILGFANDEGDTGSAKRGSRLGAVRYHFISGFFEQTARTFYINEHHMDGIFVLKVMRREVQQTHF